MIPAEAVEAAAKAIALADNFTELDWNMVPRRYTQRYYDLARAALEAAAPHMMAEAWDDAATECEAAGWLHDYGADDLRARNPHRTAK